MNWREAFRKQANSDYCVFKLLSQRDDLPVCHSLHYLQMTAEKMAKCFLTEGDLQPKASHYVIRSFINNLRTNVAVRNYLGYKGKNDAFNTLIRKLGALAEKVEGLVPKENTPNAEYPWQKVSKKDVVAPCDYGFSQEIVVYGQFKAFIEKMLKYEQK